MLLRIMLEESFDICEGDEHGFDAYVEVQELLLVMCAHMILELCRTY